MIGKNNAVTFSTKGQGLKTKLFEFLAYLEPVVFPKHHKRISFSFLLEYLQVQGWNIKLLNDLPQPHNMS